MNQIKIMTMTIIRENREKEYGDKRKDDKDDNKES